MIWRDCQVSNVLPRNLRYHPQVVPFDASQPFVEEAYSLIEAGQLDKCEDMLRDVLKKESASELHCALDLDSETFLPGLGDWLISGCANESLLDSSMAISVSMGEFEINYDNWTVSASICGGYDNPSVKDTWFAESDSPFLCDWFRVEGMEDLRKAFETDYDWCNDGSSGEPLFSPRVYTATCYLIFTLFLRVLRRVHEEALRSGHDLSRVHLFGFYGDCLYHSAPLKD